MIGEACRLDSPFTRAMARGLPVVTGEWRLKSIVAERSKYVWARVIFGGT